MRDANIDPTEEELLLMAAGKMSVPKRPVKIEELLWIPTGKVAGNAAVRAVLEDREEGLWAEMLFDSVILSKHERRKE